MGKIKKGRRKIGSKKRKEQKQLRQLSRERKTQL